VFRHSTDVFAASGVRYELETAHGLPEFDCLTFSTALVFQCMADLPRELGKVVVVNPGQGHVPVALWARSAPGSLQVVDRDLLALRSTRSNLLRNGAPPDRISLVHGLGPDPQACIEVDLLVDNLRPKEPPEAVAARLCGAAGAMRRGARLVVAGTSTAVTRAAAALAGGSAFVAEDRRRRSGFSAAIFRRP
jgi:hypothetical protein